MFEKEAEEYAQDMAMYYESAHGSIPSQFEKYLRNAVEHGYNKANEWHYVSEKGLPKESGRYLVYVGGGENGVYSLDFETEYNDFGYWCLQVGASLGVTDTIFETITERNDR